MDEERKLTQDKIFYDAMISQGTNLIESATPEQLAYLAKTRKILQESVPTKIYEENYKENDKNQALIPEANPFLYCRMRRYGRGSGYASAYAWTNDFKLYNNNASAAKMFKQFTGGNNNVHDTYALPPSMQFVGKNSQWLKSEGWLEYAASSNQYSYPCYDMILMFLKNDTENDMTREFNRFYSGTSNNGTYNSSSAYVGTPNASNTDMINTTIVDWITANNASSNTYGSTSKFNVIIPKGKTIALLFYSTPCYYTSSYNHYSFGSSIGIHKFGDFLCDGLTIDRERTIKALQFKTQNNYEIWR